MSGKREFTPTALFVKCRASSKLGFLTKKSKKGGKIVDY
jgi:hypothetical protein